MTKQVHVLDTHGKMIYTRLLDDGSDVLAFESGFGHVTRDSIARHFWTVRDGWPLTSLDGRSDDEIEEEMPENDMAPLNLSALVSSVPHISRMDCPGDGRCKCCIGCKQPLTESEFEYYENRLHLERLCKRCVMEERAR